MIERLKDRTIQVEALKRSFRVIEFQEVVSDLNDR